MSYLELRDIRKSYFLGKEEFPVLKGIDLDFELGEFVSILGESGGGKSTLMNIIGGLDREFQGSVTVDGKRLNHKEEKTMDAYRRDTIGYIYQAYNLISHLRVIDNVLVSLDMTTLTASQRTDRALELLKRVGLESQAYKYPNQLSGGQKQRVAIARALASDPQVIIADEPTGALDAENTQDVLKILNDIAEEGKLVITVTHSQAVADAGTRIVHMEDGQIDRDERLRPGFAPSTTRKFTSRALPFKHSLTNAFKHFKFSLGRNSLIVVGTAIGLFAVMLFSGLGTGINGYITKQVNSMVNPQVVTVTRHQKQSSSAAGAGGATDGQAGPPTATATATATTAAAAKKTQFTNAQITKLQNTKNVTSVQKVYSATAVTAEYNGKKATISSLANWTTSATSNSIKYGTKPGKGEIAIDQKSVAKTLSKKDWKKLIGKTITLSYTTLNKDNKMTTVKFTAKISGITKSSSSFISSNYVNTATLVDAMNKNNIGTAVSSLDVRINKLDNVEKTTKAMNKIKLDGKRAFTATSVQSIIGTVQTYINLASTVLSAIAAISLLVSALMIIVTMYMSVSARTKEIGILRALGESKRDIRRLFTSESLIIGVLSAVLATVVAFVGELGVNAMLSSIANYAFVQITPMSVISTFIIALIISLLAAILPARSAAKLNPIDALAAD